MQEKRRYKKSLLIKLLMIAFAAVLLVSEAGAQTISSYDSNGNGRIDRSEAVQSVMDFFTGAITRQEAIDMVMAYFSGTLPAPSPTSIASPTPVPTPAHAPTGELIAKSLADNITQATDNESRYKALLSVMQELNVGVYNMSGDAILRGAERGPGDFYLYDFELQMMSVSLGRQETWSVSDLTTTLNNMGIFQEGINLTEADLREILINGTRSASQNPDDNLSLIPLLVREIGMRHANPYDTLEDVPIDNLTFDALQRFLILADMMLPIVKDAGQVPVESNLPATSGGILKVARVELQDSPCKDIGNVVKEEWSAGKWALGISKKVGDKIKKAAVYIDGIHGSILAYGVEVRAMESVLKTHYGHESPGRELHFRILVNMRDDFPDLIVKCGWLAGVEFPKKGPIEGVTVLWFQDNLKKHGELMCGVACNTKTGPDGIATLVFKPKTEAMPGVGLLTEETGTVSGIALYQSKHRNVLGSIAQIMTPKSDHTRWFVEFHEPPPLELEFDSVIVGYGNSMASSHASGTVPLQFDENLGLYTGQGTLSYQTVPIGTPGCSPTYTGQGSTTLEVYSLQISGGVSAGDTPNIILSIWPGVTKETQTYICGGQTEISEWSFWSFVFLNTQPVYIDDDWTYVGGEIFAHKTIEGNCGDMCSSSTTKYVLKLKR